MEGKIKMFRLEEVEEHLTEKEIEELKNVMYMARELKQPQEVISDIGLHIVMFPSGLMRNLNNLGEEDE